MKFVAYCCVFTLYPKVTHFVVITTLVSSQSANCLTTERTFLQIMIVNMNINSIFHGQV